MLQITAFGYLGRDSEVRRVQTANGPQDVLQFNLGVKVRGKGGQQETRWLYCSIWGERANKLDQYLRSGTPLIVVGEHSINVEDKNGKTYINENINVRDFSFAGKAKDTSSQPSPSEVYHAKNEPRPDQQQDTSGGDDLPF